MNKKFLLEQLNRAEACAKDELILHKKYSDKVWEYHEYGHIEIINLVRYWISHSDYIDLKKLKKLINTRVKYNCQIIKDLDIKHNSWEKDESFKKFDKFCESDDGILYFTCDGMNCESETLLRILNKKYFYNKKTYEPTNWDELFMDKNKNGE